jgi:hypothetical protein
VQDFGFGESVRAAVVAAGCVGALVGGVLIGAALLLAWWLFDGQ